MTEWGKRSNLSQYGNNYCLKKFLVQAQDQTLQKKFCP